MDDVIRFGNVPKAVSWADELLTRPDIRSQLAQQKPGGGVFTMDDLRGFAHQVSLFVEKAEPRAAGIAMRCVWGVPKNGDCKFLADILANEAVRQYPTKRRARSRVQRLAEGIIAGERRQYYHRRPIRNAELARVIGIKRQSFRDGRWDRVAKAMRLEIQELLRVGELFVASNMAERAMLRR